MKIGYVLSNTPVRSETFFISKIKRLQENGHKVVLFANQDEKFHFCRVVPHPKVSKITIIQLVRMMITYGILFIIHPFIFFRFLQLEKKDGVWAITHRHAVFDWNRLDPSTDTWNKGPAKEELERGARAPLDPSYSS